jgi:hypothetical protein
MGRREQVVEERKITEIIKQLEGVTYKEWQIIKNCIDIEFKRLANKNALTLNESIIKNIKQELDINS